MLQIRLSKGGSSLDGGGGTKVCLVENVTVACPDHLVIADLPVAKSLGSTSSSSPVVKIVGRRSRRQLGQRIHFCVRCDFPIAVYGRLFPCEHAFCLDCARTESTCYLCEERIQKIQTIRMLEGIFICAAPHCLKSFTKKPDFESHIYDLHSDLLHAPAPDQDLSEATPIPDPPKPSITPAFPHPPLPPPLDYTPPLPLLRPLRPPFPLSSPFHQPDYRPWSQKPPTEPPIADEPNHCVKPEPTDCTHQRPPFSPFSYYTAPSEQGSVLGFLPNVNAVGAAFSRPPAWNMTTPFSYSESVRGHQQQQQQPQGGMDGKGILAPPAHLFQPPMYPRPQGL